MTNDLIVRGLLALVGIVGVFFLLALIVANNDAKNRQRKTQPKKPQP